MQQIKREIWILRHGEASFDAPQDKLRQLTAYGREQVASQAIQLKEQGVSIDQIWVSPYVRAQQTAAVFLQHFSASIDTKTEALLRPNSDVEQLVEQLQQSQVQRLLLVSHQPLVNSLVAQLRYATSNGATVEAMGTAALAHVSAQDWIAGWAELNYIRQAVI